MTIQKGSCHCGRVRFEVAEDAHGASRCDCSLCRRKGAVMLTAAREAFRLTAGEEHLSLYQWNTRTAQHYFCRHCGIYTHHWRRRRPEYGYNSGCIDGLDPRQFDNAPIAEGHKMSVVPDT
ncbi:MAG: GFA family protein [Candidatus Puniceispirillaceae bacterium]